ncbi:MAG: energy-coupling factor transporter ATPase [Defluviitaleaceae bacterium]|nr:energy-coupling factor transporter ATPase [Defluviitaleaceae bacterium]
MIKTENIHFAYAGEGDTPQALKGITTSIAAGEFVAVLGHNGSGKSTLARHLNALLAPSQGVVWINGKDTTSMAHLWEIRQTVGMVFQNPDNQLIATVVEEDVAFGPENLGIPPQQIRETVDEMLGIVGMSEFASAAPHNLSGGQKQRVAIAGVLAMRPSCIVLDEPTAMLDPSGRREVISTIKTLNDEGITIILITHFMEEAAHAKRVIVMHEGEVVLDSDPRGVFSQVETMTRYELAVPPVTALAHMLREAGLDVAGDILTVDEFAADKTIQALLATPHDYPSQASDISISSHANPNQNSNETAPIIQIKALSHIYSQGSVFERTALSDINLNINQGEMVALIGHTGSGKSTLIQHLNGLLKPSMGQVIIQGEDIQVGKSNLKAIRQKVGLVFQYPEHQLFESTIYKDVAFGPTRMGLTEAEIDEHVRQALTTVGLGEEFYEKSPFELSGGQKRRAAIAGVLAMRPSILVLDEPAAGLDPKGRDEILAQIKYMHEVMGLTVILVSHSMDDAARLTDRIVVLNQGKLLYDGTPSKVFAQAEKLTQIGLDIPQMSHLATRLGMLNKAIPQDIFTIEGLASTIMGLSLKDKGIK